MMELELNPDMDFWNLWIRIMILKITIHNTALVCILSFCCRSLFTEFLSLFLSLSPGDTCGDHSRTWLCLTKYGANICGYPFYIFSFCLSIYFCLFLFVYLDFFLSMFVCMCVEYWIYSTPFILPFFLSLLCLSYSPSHHSPYYVSCRIRFKLFVLLRCAFFGNQQNWYIAFYTAPGMCWSTPSTVPKASRWCV